MLNYRVWKTDREARTFVLVQETPDRREALEVVVKLGGKGKFTYVTQGRSFRVCTLNGKIHLDDARGLVRKVLRKN
jgi:hypothetical protein